MIFEQINKKFIVLVITLALLTIPNTFSQASSVPRYAINFTVNSNGDEPDLDLSDGLCITSNNNCTLRAALEEANTSQAGYVIHFASNMTITPASALPAIERDSVLISGIGRNVILDGSLVNGIASGILIQGSSNHVIQSLTIRNWTRSGILINGTIGVAQKNLIGTDGDGIDDSNERVILEDNFSYGIEITGAFAANNVVAGNLIGSTARPNQTGVTMTSGAHHNLIGTDGDGMEDTAERNLIQGNTNLGIGLLNAPNNTIAGNYIGLASNGSTAAPNGGGILLNGGSNFNLIGTDGDGVGDADERNIISANNSLTGGIMIQASTGNIVAGNYIGTDASGSISRGNTFGGITLSNGAHGNTIGTNGDGVGDDHEGNLISANGSTSGFVGGLVLIGVSRNIIAGNYVGTDAAGSTGLGNQGGGIVLAAASFTNIIGTNNNGMSDSIEGNLVSDNTGPGIYIGGPFNIISGNKIGTDITGTADLGNGGAGIYLLSIQDGDASDNLIGGSSTVQGNIIAFNGSQGVLIQSTNGIPNRNNALLTNSIFSNDRLGIDLYASYDPGNGVTPNDPKDRDSGVNDLLNSPEITTASSFGGKTFATIQINDSLRNSNFHVQIFSNPACDPSGFGEGQTFIGQVRLTTDASGNATTGMVTFNVATPGGDFLTATASLNQPLSTSEFSRCKVVSTDLSLVPACYIKDSFFNLKDHPLQSMLLLILFPSILTAAGLGAGKVISRHQDPSIQVRSRSIGGVVGGIIGLVLLGLTSQAPSCIDPISLNPPGLGLDLTSSDPAIPTVTTTGQEGCTYTATVNLFCRWGPGTQYEGIDTFIAGQMAPVVGKSIDGYYWYVTGPTTGKVCTVPNGIQFGEVSGDCSILPAYTPIPLPTDLPGDTPKTAPTCIPGVVGC